MKKLVLTGVLSVGTLLGANLPGLEVITASAAIPSSLSIAEGNSQQTLFEQQREKYTGIVTEKTNQGLTIFTENVPASVLKNINIGDSVDIYSSYSSKGAENKAEDFIIGSITESDIDYVIVEYKNNGGKTENVDVLLSKGHSFKVGDKVKVTNKEKWEHKKIGLHHVKFASEDSIFKVTENDSEDPISKVAEKEAEDFIIGTVIDSDSDYGYATVEYKNNEGKTEIVDVTFTEAHSYKVGDKVKVTNKSKWEHKKIGPNNVTFASGDYISKVAEKETEDFIIGTVIDSDSDYGYATVEYKNNEGKTGTVDVTFTEAHSYKVGDKVKVTNKSKWEHKKIGPNNVTFASGDYISKVAEKEAEDFIIGTVIDSDSDYGYATVEYKNNEGKTEIVDVTFTEAHSYKVGDKVKVTNKSKWEHKKIGPNNVTFASGDYISKVTENE